jgi:hypothetical protein
MKREITITLDYSLAIGKVNLNEIVYQLKELRDPLMLEILKEILTNYDDFIVTRLKTPKISPGKTEKELSQHKKKGAPQGEYCEEQKIQKRGYRATPKHITTAFGTLFLPIRYVECCRCERRYSPLLNALQVEPYSRREINFEREVIESVIDTNYRRLIDGRSIDISLGGVHNIVVGSDIDKEFQETVSMDDLSAIMGDGTGVKQVKGKKGELRAVIGVTRKGRVLPLGCFTNVEWPKIEKTVRNRIEETGPEAKQYKLPFVYDGEPGLDNFLADIAESQRCTWHGPRGLYHSLWEDGLKKKESQPAIDKIKKLVGIELPEGDYEILKEADKDPVRKQYEKSKKEIRDLIETFSERGYGHAVTYLNKLSERLFTNIELWLETGVISPKTTSLLERVFRELGRRLKKIAWGWSDQAVTNISKMILLRQYSREQWEEYWKKKLGIRGYFQVHLNSVTIS